MRKNDDLISRQDALSFLRNWERVKDYSWGERNIIKATINEIESLPSAQSELKKGEWIEVQFKTFPYNRIGKARKCSMCGKRKDKYVRWNFCPNCGADMRGDNHDQSK